MAIRPGAAATLLAFSLFFGMRPNGAGADGGLQQTDIFLAGAEGYHTYRIPALIRTKKGTLLAFCEGRKGGTSDTGNIDLVLKRSLDDGITWGAIQRVADEGSNTIGNPCPVIDRTTGVIWLLLTHNLGKDSEAQILDQTAVSTRTVWLSKSADEGETWAPLREITTQVKPTNWTWYATGPGIGIQLRSGRLVIPSDHYLAGSKVRRSHVIYSDDSGGTWHRGGSIGDHCNECQVVELNDDSLLINMRSYHGKNRRAIAVSRDAGRSWSEPELHPELIDPVCQASLIRLEAVAGAKEKDHLLFSNPASTRRANLTVRRSDDGGKTWPVAKSLHAGPAAYSCLAELADPFIGCLYERGDQRIYERITFARFTLEWLGR